MAGRKSPYLILGVAFGASKEDAARAYARATRRLRRHTGAPYDLEDLNWALHAVEQRIEDPATSVDDYRMPGDTGVYEVPRGPGVLSPPVQPYRRRTAPADLSEIDSLLLTLVREIGADIARRIEQTSPPRLHFFETDRNEIQKGSS